MAASNIAWARSDEAEVAGLLRELGFEGVEIAPTAVWAQPLQVSDAEIRAYRESWERRGLPIVAMQALLFGRPDLTIFGDATKRAETFEHLAGMIRLGGKLGVGALVFGSPKNRLAGSLSPSHVEDIALPFFHGLGQLAAEHGTRLCIEPNPSVYGCDYVTTSQQGLALVRKVGSPGFCLHLDAGGMTLSGEPVDDALLEALRVSQHFHVSEANLAPIGTGSVTHEQFAAALRQAKYERWVSVEMRAPPGPVWREQLRAALTHARQVYGAAS
ncbi:sugar phosphate isomerase/epimerase family protein [Hyalangium versicolor]|uniref:sugar phosphate isomerase/epimerase family protein n=1 Tax=Hyalangium versicolor TaxID=2861190 RepID=UPI001CCD23FE|nr:sugar phosphate isomerase/epimerase family protein [Hyalangium versicolor]